MSDSADSNGFLRSAGENVGGFLAGIPSAIRDFFSGVGEGAGVYGFLDWAALIIGIALLISAARGFGRGRIVGPVLRGFIGLAVMGWAVV
ncbi:hypothetical protein CWI75_00405 [Kineobactrum sediminis]|uniref:Uncharacterized protein n=1 Tax=Kineobactrum sediminis TaxID=1905677 RepID=A0A2N5Y654_9GAMM|nr:hypothetical protein [Kineobactrum sediminis]PLW83859.1 hypothetical protein CWI75_00405 [Kineobactrum sediminis]